MHDGKKQAVCEYRGVLADICDSFIEEKRAVGCLYNTEAKILRDFSRFTLNFDCPENTLTKEIVQAWITKRPMDSDRTQYARYSLISQFARYMERMGYASYVPGRDEIGKLHKSFVPYIFSHREIRDFFAAADAMTCLPHSIAPRRHLIMPVLFRMLYCCGLRVSEAANLLADDVDLARGVLTIQNSKFGKTRYVPMSEELTVVCSTYAKTRLVGPKEADWFFAAPEVGITTPDPYTTFSVDFCGKLGYLMVDAETALAYMISDIHSAYTVCKSGRCGVMIQPLCCPS